MEVIVVVVVEVEVIVVAVVEAAVVVEVVGEVMVVVAETVWLVESETYPSAPAMMTTITTKAAVDVYAALRRIFTDLLWSPWAYSSIGQNVAACCCVLRASTVSLVSTGAS